MVFDEPTQSYVPRIGRFGIKKIEEKRNWIVEVKPQDDPNGGILVFHSFRVYFYTFPLVSSVFLHFSTRFECIFTLFHSLMVLLLFQRFRV
jgi:DNA modification methylase